MDITGSLEERFAIPISQSQIRPALMFGMFDQMASMKGLLYVILFNMLAWSGWFFALSVCLYGVYIALLSALAKYDPWFFDKFYEYISLQTYYRAHSDIGAPDKRIIKW